MSNSLRVQIRSFFWSVFSRTRIEYGYLRCKSLYSARVQKNTDQKKLSISTLHPAIQQTFIEEFSYILLLSVLQYYGFSYLASAELADCIACLSSVNVALHTFYPVT